MLILFFLYLVKIYKIWLWLNLECKMEDVYQVGDGKGVKKEKYLIEWYNTVVLFVLTKLQVGISIRQLKLKRRLV
jgi:hypothetical protein